MLRPLLATLLLLLPAVACGAGFAIVLQDKVALRAAPRASAPANASLSQGESLEVRGERLDYLQVWDYKRERGGYVRVRDVRRVALTAEEAPDLLAVVRFLRGMPGAESLGVGYAAAYIQAAPAAALRAEPGIEALDALGGFAERLAQRGTAAHLDVAARYGVAFVTIERAGRMHICYEGDAFRRVLAMSSSPEQRARAALALTRADCLPGELRPLERRQVDEWRAETLERVDAEPLAAGLKNRVRMRRAEVWSTLAYQRSRAGDAAAEVAALRALGELALVAKEELGEEDQKTYAEAAIRVNASRWAAGAPAAASAGKRPHLLAVEGAPGETCLLLVEGKRDLSNPLARRCTYGIAWTGSASLNREGNALALAVQTMEAWRELWVFHKTGAIWSVRVLPPAAAQPGLGYAEFAGWVPGGAQVLVAREAIAEGRHKRNFELVRIDTLATVRHAPEASQLGAFQRWQDAAWKRESVSLR